MTPARTAVRILLGGAAGLFALIVLNHSASAAIGRAALVIEHGSGQLLRRCVNFGVSQISGFELLRRSGINFVAQNYGGSLGEAICQIDNEPNPLTQCLSSGPYWQYYIRSSNRWVRSAAGASNQQVRDGEVDAWHYAAAGGGADPPPITFAQVCGPPAAGPAAQAKVVRPPSQPTAATAPTSIPTLIPSAVQSALATRVSPANLPGTGSGAGRPATASSSPLAAAPLGLVLLLLLVLLARNFFFRRAP